MPFRVPGFLAIAAVFTAQGQRTRDRILIEVRANPGITINEVAKRLGIRWNGVRHHVRVLEGKGVISVERGWSHALYAVEVPPKYRAWLRALRDNDSRQVLGVLLQQGEMGAYELSHHIGTSQAAVRHQLARLMDEGIVDKIGQLRPHYRAREVPPAVHALMETK